MNTSIFSINDYRQVIRAWIDERPKQGRGERSRMADHLQINMTQLSQILSGTRDLTFEQGLQLAQYMGFSGLVLDYFLLLVQKSRSGHFELTSYLDQKIESCREESLKLSQRIEHEKVLTDIERSEFYSSWLYSAIHLFTSLNSKGVTLEEIMQRFSIDRPHANQILSFLCENSFCQESKGRYTMSTQSTFLPQGSPFLIHHHINWRLKAMNKAEKLDSTEELMYTGQISVSRADLARIRELAVIFFKQVNDITRPSEPELVANLNLDLFKVV